MSRRGSPLPVQVASRPAPDPNTGSPRGLAAPPPRQDPPIEGGKACAACPGRDHQATARNSHARSLERRYQIADGVRLKALVRVREYEYVPRGHPHTGIERAGFASRPIAPHDGDPRSQILEFIQPERRSRVQRDDYLELVGLVFLADAVLQP